jgi:LSD1 subclass zinc finger protein
MNNTFDQDFCPACGTILPLPDGSSIIQCLLCRKIQDISGLFEY